MSLVPLADYDAEHPDRAYLIIEVADSSLATDRARKAALYAACHVPEYWVVNLTERQVEVHTEPVSGMYMRVAIFAHGTRIALHAFPELELAVDDFIR